MSFTAVPGEDCSMPFISATITIISTMSGLSADVGTPYTKQGSKACGLITGIVGVTGDKNGSIAVTFSKDCAEALVKGMLGDEIHDLMEDAQDAVGEITNMISGQARAGLVKIGLNLQGSTPTVIMGENHTIRHGSSAPVIAIPFTTTGGEMTVEYCFE